jgi:mRNA deadenylase 3'-5' endonuclease subunit Ccr4
MLVCVASGRRESDGPTHACADVICLQEVEFKDVEADFGAEMRDRGYDYRVQCDTNRKHDHTSGCATFFRTSKFTLHSSQSRSRTFVVTLALTRPTSDVDVAADENFPVQTDAVVAVDEKTSERERAQELKKAKKRQVKTEQVDSAVIVVNVHLEGHPMMHHRRFEQLKSVLQKTIPTLGRDSCVFVVGDFNCPVDSSACQLLTEGSIPVRVVVLTATRLIPHTCARRPGILRTTWL